jgi:hypothetical protein
LPLSLVQVGQAGQWWIVYIQDDSFSPAYIAGWMECFTADQATSTLEDMVWYEPDGYLILLAPGTMVPIVYGDAYSTEDRDLINQVLGYRAPEERELLDQILGPPLHAVQRLSLYTVRNFQRIHQSRALVGPHRSL